MPIYQYKCNNCGHKYEQLYLSFSAVDREEKDEPCPKCGSKDKFRCPPAGTSFQLKGSGWARDRYKGKG